MKVLKGIETILVLTALLSLFLVGAAYGQEQTVHVIKIKDFNFHPPELIIYEGDTVLWENTMPYGHWVISGADMKHDGRYFSPLLLNKHTFNQAFDEPVVQDYYCPIHSMQGRITVLKRKVAPGVKVEKPPVKEKKKRRRSIRD